MLCSLIEHACFSHSIKTGDSCLPCKIRKSAISLLLTVNIKKTLYTLKDIYQQIFFAKVIQNLNQLLLVGSDFHVSLQGVSAVEYL